MAEVPYLGSAPWGAKCDHCYNPARYVAIFGCKRHGARATRSANDYRDAMTTQQSGRSADDE